MQSNLSHRPYETTWCLNPDDHNTCFHHHKEIQIPSKETFTLVAHLYMPAHKTGDLGSSPSKDDRCITILL
jgi:hypothetical protein